jgi:hypothetical protein
MLVAPFNDLAVPVVVPFPSAFVVVVAPVDFAAGAGVGLVVGAESDACSVGTFGTTIAEGVAAADAACARLVGAAAGDSTSAGSERSKLEKVAGADWVLGAGDGTATAAADEDDMACADAALEGAAAFAAAAGAAARTGGATGAGFGGSDCNTGGDASPIISNSEPPGFQASDSARKLDAGDFGTSSSVEAPTFGKSSNSRMSSIAWGDSDCGSGAGAATGAAGGVKAIEAGAARAGAAVGAAPFAVAGAWKPFALVLVAGFDAAAAAPLAGAGGTEAVRGAAG